MSRFLYPQPSPVIAPLRKGRPSPCTGQSRPIRVKKRSSSVQRRISGKFNNFRGGTKSPAYKPFTIQQHPERLLLLSLRWCQVPPVQQCVHRHQDPPVRRVSAGIARSSPISPSAHAASVQIPSGHPYATGDNQYSYRIRPCGSSWSRPPIAR